ncbi:MAG: RNA polymerase subunit sigma-70 [Planctomycetota bacterium]|nr:MAG: RNA polymerase subunit sigma-70 [Planctomycetota bacterium]
MFPAMDSSDAQAERLIFDESLPAEERARLLLPLVYQQLRACAQEQLRAERPGHTLSATALVHEAWLKLAGPREVPWQSCAHFLDAAVKAMKQILQDYGKARRRVKRGGGRARLDLDAAVTISACDDENPWDSDALDQAIRRLGEKDPRAARIVEWRFYTGLTNAQAAQALGVSEGTVKNDWKHARAWLADQLNGRL